MLITPTHGLLTGYTAVAFLILILLVTFSLAVQVHVVLDFVYALFTPFLGPPSCFTSAQHFKTQPLLSPTSCLCGTFVAQGVLGKKL